jgi:hypothetical protein
MEDHPRAPRRLMNVRLLDIDFRIELGKNNDIVIDNIAGKIEKASDFTIDICYEIANVIHRSGIRHMSDFLYLRDSEIDLEIFVATDTINVRSSVRKLISLAKQEFADSQEIKPDLRHPSTDHDTMLALKDSLNIMAANQNPRFRKPDGINRRDTSDDESPPFDLASVLRNKKISLIPIDWFGDVRKLSKFRKFFEKAKASGKPRPYFVAGSSLEEWIPPWVGAGESQEDQRSLNRAWSQKIDNQPPARVLSMVLSFWISHAAIGICKFEAVFSHILMFIRMQDQYGIAFAIKHERRLLDRCYTSLKASVEFDIDDLLSRPCPDIVQEILLTKAIEDKPRAPIKLPGKSPPAPGASAASGTSTTDQAKVKDVKSVRKPVCFDHNPSQGIFCPLKSKCLKEHLDTKVESLLVRFEKAKSCFKGKRSE